MSTLETEFTYTYLYYRIGTKKKNLKQLSKRELNVNLQIHLQRCLKICINLLKSHLHIVFLASPTCLGIELILDNRKMLISKRISP